MFIFLGAFHSALPRTTRIRRFRIIANCGGAVAAVMVVVGLL
jgi:hypothetical protein